MCGIAGIFRFDGQKVNMFLLKKMNSKMIHRGPDDEGYFLSQNFGMCMRRLAIIDVQGGKQPVFSEDKRYVVVMNGEIYNYKELRERLIKKGHYFKTNSDTEVIVHLFEEYGIDFIHHLNGMFAFALWDNLEKVLYIFRDRIGIKPLYYITDKNFFAFASSILALIECLPQVTINYTSFLKYLGLGYIPYPETIYNNLKKLEPGGYLEIKHNDIKHGIYWELPKEQEVNEIKKSFNNTIDYKKYLRSLIEDAVRLQIRSDVPVGVFLSGGLDSSTVTALTSQLIPEKLNAFSVGFVGGYDELQVTKKLAKIFNVEHHTFQLFPEQILSLLYELMEYLDEPISDNSIIPSYLLSKMARNEGIPVILTGAGGDELFGGYHRYFPKTRGIKAGLLYTLPDKLRFMIGYIYKFFHEDEAYRVMDKKLDFIISISGTGLGLLKNLLCDPKDSKYIINFLQEHYNRYVNNTTISPTKACMYFDLRSYLVDDILALTDKMSMAHSVEARVPLLDHRIVEFCYSLPKKMLFPTERPKTLLKEICSDLLPSFIFELPKSGFAGPSKGWSRFIAMNGVVKKNFVDNPTEFFKEHFNLKEVKKLLKCVIHNRNRYSYTSLWHLFIFDLWYRVHISKDLRI